MGGIFRYLAPGTAAVVVISLASVTDFARADHGPVDPGFVDILAIDADVTGNTDSAIGPIEQAIGTGFCDVPVDIVIDEVPPYDGVFSGGLSGFGANLIYNPSVISIVGFDYDYMLFRNGPPPFFVTPPHDDLPDTDGNFRFDVPDVSPDIESGVGVLARLQIRGLNPGFTTLDLGDDIGADATPDVYDAAFVPYTLNNVNDGLIGVDHHGCIPYDEDGDGVCGNPYSCQPVDNCPTISNPGQEDADGDDSGNVCDNCPLTPNGPGEASIPGTGNQTDSDANTVGDACQDTDGDSSAPPDYATCSGSCPGGRWRDSIEVFIGTDPNLRCPDAIPLNEAVDAWPTDFNDDRLTGMADVMIGFQGRMNSPPNSGYWTRADFNADGAIRMADVLFVIPYFNKRCSLP